jgi:serine/threonine protein kinase
LFLAPEVLEGKPFDSTSDVYSFAITAWEVFNRKEAFSEFTNFGMFKRAICVRDVRPPLTPEMPQVKKENRHLEEGILISLVFVAFSRAFGALLAQGSSAASQVWTSD